MSTNKTQNLNLHSWVETDPVLMSEFNENFGAIDNMSSQVFAQIATMQSNLLKTCKGTYSGDGQTSHTLFFPFKPFIIYVRSDSHLDAVYFATMYSEITSTKVLFNIANNNYKRLNITWNDDNSVTYATVESDDYAPGYALNDATKTYSYFMLGV